MAKSKPRSVTGVTRHAHKTSALHHAKLNSAVGNSVRRVARRISRRGAGSRAQQIAVHIKSKKG